MRIGIIGNYGATNVGDDAILKAILRDCEGHDVTVFSADPESTRQKFQVKTAPLFPFGPRSLLKTHLGAKSLKALKACDGVILGGGGLFQDAHSYAVYLWAWQLYWVKKLKKPLFIYATGVGPLLNPLSRRLTKNAYQQAKLITVRDQYSKHALVEIGLSPNKILTGADPAFSYKASKIKKTQGARVLVSLRPWKDTTERTIAQMASFLSKLKLDHNASFKFIVMQGCYESDHRLLQPLSEALGGPVITPGSYEDLLEHMAQADLAIGMRYHFLIAALLTSTPAIPITYSPKVTSLYQSASHLSHLPIQVDMLNEKKLENTFEFLVSHPQNTQKYLERLKRMLIRRQKNSQDSLKKFIKQLDEAS